MRETEDEHGGETASEQVEDAELLRMAIADALLDVHTGLPARVESYDKAAGTVDVTLMLNRLVSDGNGGNVSEELPGLVTIPVRFPRTKQFEITFPLAKGDTGLVMFCEQNIGKWRATGNQSDPGDVGRFTLDGAVFAPGLYDDKNAPKNADDNNMVLGSTSDGNSRIEIKPNGGLNLGAGAMEGVVTKKDLQALYFAINAAAVVAQDGGAAFKANILTGLGLAGWTTGATDGQLASTKIKAVR